MDHNAGPRAACVTMLTMLLVFLLSAIAIVFRIDDRTAGALRAALACLIFVYLAYLLFEVKVLQLLFSLFHPATYDPQPPLSFVGPFSPLGSSVGRELSPEEAAAGGRASPAPPSEAGYMASDSEYMPEPAPYFFSGGGGCYHRRRAPSTGIHRSSSSRRSLGGSSASRPSSVSSSSEVTDLLTSEDEVESWMGGSSSASRSPSRAGGGRRRLSRHGGGTVAYTKRKHTKR